MYNEEIISTSDFPQSNSYATAPMRKM